ncbi:hypothetical protein HYV10_01910 [Candidatus Dependentiae bacterium]|nr:hypothetical protein [Candidatus Dependentiae bacterium]
MNMYLRILCIIACSLKAIASTLPPAGLFVPYDINIKQRKPGHRNWQFTVFAENSYHMEGYATDTPKEEKTIMVNPLQVYEPIQNIVSMYQGYDANGSITQTISTPFTELLDSIAAGPGGGVSNYENGIFKPTGKLSCAELAFGTIYGIGHGFYVSAFLPAYFAKLSDVDWYYKGNNALFSDEKIQNELINSFYQDALEYFDLNVGNWKRKGLGDLAIIAEWQKDFPQVQRKTLRNVQVNTRLGMTFPTGKKPFNTIIMPINFSAGTIGIPFGAGLNLNLGSIVEIGFSGQFWYYWSNEQISRIKTFPTQTTLLLPILTNTQKEFAIIQNFNLNAVIYSFCKRFALKSFYQYWRKGEDKIIPLSNNFSYTTVNSDLSLAEQTRHQFCFMLMYSPQKDDFKKIIPQFEFFWKISVNGMRSAVASSYGGQFSLIF